MNRVTLRLRVLRGIPALKVSDYILRHGGHKDVKVIGRLVTTSTTLERAVVTVQDMEHLVDSYEITGGR